MTRFTLWPFLDAAYAMAVPKLPAPMTTTFVAPPRPRKACAAKLGSERSESTLSPRFIKCGVMAPPPPLPLPLLSGGPRDRDRDFDGAGGRRARSARKTSAARAAET